MISNVVTLVTVEQMIQTVELYILTRKGIAIHIVLNEENISSELFKLQVAYIIATNFNQ